MNKPNSTAALLAIFSLLATPVAAAEQPRAASQRPVDAAPPTADDGMTAEWRRGYRYRRNRGVDLGDVLTGVLIIGGIAAVADAARDAERERARRERDYEYERRDRRDADRYARDISASEAAETCLEESERFGDVDDFDLVRRTGDGWRVEGRMADGTPFACEIDADGRVRELGRGSVGDAAYSYREDAGYDAGYDAQGEVDYAAARARQGGYAYRDSGADGQGGESYPGGPVDGDLYPGG